MGKKNKDKNKELKTILSDEVISTLSKKQRGVLIKKLSELSAEQRITCSHTNENGKPTGKLFDNGDFDCEVCGSKFNVAIIDPKDIQKAIRLCNNMINQIKLSSGNGKEDRKTIRTLGETIENLMLAAEIYGRLTAKDKGNKKKKKHKDDSYGSYGSTAIKLNHGKKRDW